MDRKRKVLIYRKLEDPLIDRFSNLLKPTFKVAWLMRNGEPDTLQIGANPP